MTSTAVKLRSVANEAPDKSESQSSPWPGPRKVSLQRNAAGFGFTLRHFIVYPPESAVAELSRQEGAASGDDRNKKRPKIAALEPMDTIFVKHVKQGGSAEAAGLSTGDRIVSVNGESVTGKTYSQVVGLIQSSDCSLKLLVVPREEDILQVAYPTSAYKTPDGTPDSQPEGNLYGSRSGIYDPATYPSAIPSPSGRTADEVHDTLILHPETPDLLGHNHETTTRHKSEMVLAVGAKPVKTSTPVYDSWASTRAAIDSHTRGVSTRASSTGEHLADAAGRNSNYAGSTRQPTSQSSSKPSIIDSRYGYHQSRPTSGISISSNSSGDSSVSGQKTGRTFKITSIFGAQNRGQSRRGANDPQRADGVAQRRATADSETQLARPLHKSSSRNEVASRALGTAGVASSHGASDPRFNPRGRQSGATTVRLRTGTGPNDFVGITGQRHSDFNGGRPAPRQSNSMDNLVSGSDDHVDVRHGGGQVSSSYDNLHLSGTNGTEWEVWSSDKAISAAPADVKKLGSDGQVNRRETVTRRYARTKQTEVTTTTTNTTIANDLDGNARSNPDMQGFDEIADPHMRELFMRQAKHQRDRRGYEKRDPPGHISSSQSADSVRYPDTRPKRSNTVSAAKTQPQVVPAERRYSQFPNMVKIIGLDGNVQMTAVSNDDVGIEDDYNMDNNGAPEPLSPTKIQDRISYWEKKPQKASPTDVVDAVNSWGGGGGGSSSREPPSTATGNRYRVTTHIPQPGAREKPPVPKRDSSSRGRVRERSMERERQHERKIYERHRSKSYDRSSNQRSGAAWFRGGGGGGGGTARRQTTDDMSVDSLTSEGAISLASSRKESTASSVSDGCSVDEDYPPGTRQRLVRRTSYLRATLSDEEEAAKNVASSSVVETTSISSMSQQGGDGSSPVVLRRNPTPRRQPSINKLKHIFGEGTPVITEVVQKLGIPKVKEGQQDVTKEGPANIKLELKEWKRASDRSWKPVWMVLKSQTMYLMKERREANISPSAGDDRPISIKASMVDIAYDYTKKKNVFRLSTCTGSEYLIQVSNTNAMLSWITAIQANLTPGGQEIVSSDLIMHKSHQHDITSGAGGTHPTTGSKHLMSPPNSRKKGSRSPSPALPAKKQSTGLAGKMKHRMKKRGGTSGGSTWGQPTAEELKSLTFGVPLEKCTPSTTNEFVPMFADVCCNIVEDLGLDIVGIYRIPGNTAGVTYLQEDLKAGPEEGNFGDARWRDVNIVSSLLKMFFRKLPNPMVPKDQYKDFIAANRCKDPSDRMWALRRQVHNLPDHHYETFKFLASHLRLVSLNSDVNKMEVRNLAIVFGPTLIRSGDNSMVTMVTDMSDQCCIIESIIQHSEWFFSDDVESQQAVPSDAMPEAELMSSDASEILSRAKKDTQSGESGSDSSKGKDINPRDLVSSVISAANRKLKGKAVKKSHQLNIDEANDEAEFGFADRTGREGGELKVRAIRNQTTGDKNSSVDEEEDGTSDDKQQWNPVRVTLRTSSQSSVETNVETESTTTTHVQTYASAREQSHPQRGGVYHGRQYRSGERGRTLSGEGNGKAPLQGANNNNHSQSWKADAVPDWKSEYSQERERIEHEHRKAVRDYEKEDDTANVEELYRGRDYLREISAVSSKIADFASQGYTDEESVGGNRRPGRSLVASELVVSVGASSNNNNTLHAARSDPIFNTTLEIRESASESDSDFVQGLKATFEERLERVVHQEETAAEEEDRTSESASSSGHNADHRRGATTNGGGLYTAAAPLYHRTGEEDGSHRERTSSGTYLRNLRQIAPKTNQTAYRSNELSVAPQSAAKLSTSTPSSPVRGSQTPRKTSRIEVILTLQKTGRTSNENLLSLVPATTPTTTKHSQRESPSKREPRSGDKKQKAAKDTMSIKEQHRESRRRRHTVGGGRDAPEYRKIMEYNMGKDSTVGSQQRSSAVDRLRPFGKPAKEPSQPKNMKSWMDNERVRTNSSPNILASVALSPSGVLVSKPRSKSVGKVDGAKMSLIKPVPHRKDGHPQKFSYV